MFYFFERGSDYVRCEIRPDPKSNTCEVLVAEGNLPERIENYVSWEAAQIRWNELKQHFLEDGWMGPIGRE